MTTSAESKAHRDYGPADGASAGDVLQCRAYTRARRFPLVIGSIGGYALPTPMTIPQAATLAATALALLATRSAWAHLPGQLDVLVLICVPIALAWAVRRMHGDGRSPLRAAAGWGRLLTAAPRGVVLGRPLGPPCRATARGRVFVGGR